MNGSGMLKPALIGGVLLGVCSALPLISILNCVCCAWVIVGGALAAYLYVKESSAPVTLGRGITLGLLTGVIGTIVSTAISSLMRMVLSSAGVNVMDQVKQALNRIPNLPPGMRETIDNMAAQGNIGVVVFILGALFTLFIYCIFAMIGGAIGVAIFEKRKGGPGPSDVTAYQPPSNPPTPPDAV
jgi:hypothetical protein